MNIYIYILPIRIVYMHIWHCINGICINGKLNPSLLLYASGHRCASPGPYVCVCVCVCVCVHGRGTRALYLGQQDARPRRRGGSGVHAWRIWTAWMHGIMA